MTTDTAAGVSGIKKLIITSPYREPDEHWKYHPETKSFTKEPSRREAGFVVASRNARAWDDPGVFFPLPLVNQIRPRVKAWREAGYPNATGVTRDLLAHWRDPERVEKRLFFCQLEAIETLIFLAEAPEADKVGIEIPSDGGSIPRECCKLATGGGKTIVMGLLIAWQTINAATYGARDRYSQNILAVAPGLTVKSRLQVLVPDSEKNIYDEFDIVPSGMHERLSQAKVEVLNWHRLLWEDEDKIARKKSVDKRGALSDEAYVRQALTKLSGARNLIVINDEAHHAWRLPEGMRMNKEVRDGTKWMMGMDRINWARGIRKCYDFTATPFVPIGKENTEKRVYSWIVSDFGLNDAIEAGLVKTPRVVVQEDTASLRPKLYHIYDDPEVKDNIADRRNAPPEEGLPDLVRQAYRLLGADWKRMYDDWMAKGAQTPPVMISVVNNTNTAARIAYAFKHRMIGVDPLWGEQGLLQIDSKVLESVESLDEVIELEAAESEEDSDEPKKLTRKEQANHLRHTVNTVGRKGEPGEQIKNVISVDMLSEGWDTRTVTHIMGIRAFDSQLLCEQVVGRGLRRTDYEVGTDGLYTPDYVNVYGVPFTFLPHEGQPSGPPPPTGPKTRIEVVPERRDFELAWPNVERIAPVYRPHLTIDWKSVPVLELQAGAMPTQTWMAGVVDSKPNLALLTEIDLEKLDREFRLQTFVFDAARELFQQTIRDFKQGSRVSIMAQMVKLVEEFLESDRLRITPPLFATDPKRRKVILRASQNRIVQHMAAIVHDQGAEHLELVMDEHQPVGMTGDMRPWFTGRPALRTSKSHINFCVVENKGGWEKSEADELDTSPHVTAWAKNDHLGFEIRFTYNGVAGRRYLPDFIVRLSNGEMLILEVKGQTGPEVVAKRQALQQWVRAVNEDGRFGKWHEATSSQPKEILEILDRLIAAQPVMESR